MASMKIEIQSRKLLKPSIPTPPELRHYKISFIDEFAPVMNIPVVLFYSAADSTPMSISDLQKSLQKILTRFRPLAGRYLKDTHTVDCNDQGAEFIQARVNITLDQILVPKLQPSLVDEFVPLAIGAADGYTDPILATQVTVFECGGIAIGVNIAHRVSDASTLCTFLKEWANLTRDEEIRVEHVRSGFNSYPLFPSRGLPPLDMGFPRSRNTDVLNKFVTKRLSFSDESILKMKKMAIRYGKTGTRQPSKVQLVTAMIWKAFIGVDQAIHGYRRAAILTQPINLREKTASIIPKQSCGNIWAILRTEFESSEALMEFEGLADRLTDTVNKAVNEYSNVRHDSDEWETNVVNSFSNLTDISEKVNAVALTSWCKFGFYEADFGWGKPVWISSGSLPLKRMLTLLDDEGGNGVEAYVAMEVEEVPYFEQDHNIKAFAT